MVDLTHLDFSLSMWGSGSAGSFYKACDGEYFYKVSLIFRDGFGYESVNEVLCSRLADLFGYANAGYELLEARVRLSGQTYETYICRSKNYKRVGESRLSMETYCSVNDIEKGYLEPLIFKPFFLDLLNMLFFDYIIDNRDRHGANIELLYNGETYRLSPIFDCGSSLLAPCQYETNRILGFDYLHDGPVNNFFVSVFWDDVLEKLKSLGFRVPDVDIKSVYYNDLYAGFEGADCILDKEIEMIFRRYAYAKEILNT